MNVNSTPSIFGALARVRLDQIYQEKGDKQNRKEDHGDLFQAIDVF